MLKDVDAIVVTTMMNMASKETILMRVNFLTPLFLF